MKKAVIYARYSSDRQTEQSIEGQLRACYDYAKRNQIIIIDEYIDRATTGTNYHRPAFQKLMHDCHNSFWDYVIVYKLDRFSRNKYEMITHRKTLKDNNIKLLSATEGISDSAEGILLESLLEGMAEYYSVDLSQKTKRGLNESRQKNQFTGGHILYGYTVKDKKVYVNEDEANVVRHIYEQHLSGKFINEIVKDLTDKGIYYRGKPFKEGTVYKFLKNEKYIGIFRHEDEVFTNTYPAIISKNVFDAVREKMNSNHYGKHKKDVKYLLKDKLICGCCGGKIQSGSGSNKDGSIRRYYNCATRMKFKTCTKEHIKKELLEQIVIDTTFKMFEDKENLEILSDKIVEIHNSKVEDVAFLNLLDREKKHPILTW